MSIKRIKLKKEIKKFIDFKFNKVPKIALKDVHIFYQVPPIVPNPTTSYIPYFIYAMVPNPDTGHYLLLIDEKDIREKTQPPKLEIGGWIPDNTNPYKFTFRIVQPASFYNNILNNTQQQIQQYQNILNKL